MPTDKDRITSLEFTTQTVMEILDEMKKDLKDIKKHIFE